MLPGLRPTPDRVRETLFNWLQPVIGGARCLDLFCGSGALGLEAASRGAATVTLVDRDRRVVRALQARVIELAAAGVEVVQADALGYLERPRGPFDVVFLDPPYGGGLLPACCLRLERSGALATLGRVYVEAEAELGVPELPQGWRLIRSKRAGAVGYHLAQRCCVGHPAR